MLLLALRLRLGSSASVLGHGHEALTLAAVHALAAVLRGLALGHALTGIDALTLHGGGIRCECSGADYGSEQHGGSGSHGGARQFIDLHFLFLESFGTQRNCCSCKRPGQRPHYYSIR